MVRSSGVDFYFDRFALCLAPTVWFPTQTALDQMLFDDLYQCSYFFKKPSDFPHSAISHSLDTFSNPTVFLFLVDRTRETVHLGISASVWGVGLFTGMGEWLAPVFTHLLDQ